MGNFIDTLKTSRNEKDVENNYRGHFNAVLGRFAKSKNDNIGTITSQYNTDGFLKYRNKDEKVNINCLFEFKKDVEFMDLTERSRVIIQCLYYMKTFEKNGDIIPTSLFIADINQYFIINTSILIGYLDYDLNWKIAPSKAGFQNNELLMKIIQNDELNKKIYVVDVDEKFNTMEILKKINNITKGFQSKLKITSYNVYKIYNSFNNRVLKEKNLSVNDSVNLFIHTLIDRDNNYPHPTKKNILVTKGFGEIKINTSNWNSYKNHFNTVLSPREKEIITATQDRLIEDETRKRSGEFFTPTIWVDESHKMVTETLDKDWKNKIVWDNACGTGNLTRDYKFKELYSSTLLKSDIDTMEQAGYNPESTKFQYDFLNDGINDDGEIDVENDTKLPYGLKNAILNGKEIYFFINPPYGTANDHGEKNKKGTALTKTNLLMKKDDWGASSQQLYAQFLYKINKIHEKYNCIIKLCLFSPPLLLSGGSYKKFRDNFFKNFNFKTGYLINANNFSDVSDWGLSFSIFETDKEHKTNDFNYIVKVNELEIIDKEIKNIYNLDNGISASKWVREKVKNNKNILKPSLNGPLKVKDSKTLISENSLGYMHNNANNVGFNPTYVGIYSSTFASAHGLSITKDNYMDVVSLFLARKSIPSNWINQKDEYMAPTEEVQNSDKYKQFNNDAIVYSLFNTSSNQSSMRQVEYKDKLWDIKNEFFWMNNEEMLELAEEYKFDELYKDARTSKDRYVYDLLKSTPLSPDAKELLEMSKELIRKSFEWRKIMHQSNPEYHLNAWDAGWYQIKKILNEHFKEEYKIFVEKYKKFENRLRPQVYELGFLKSDEVVEPHGIGIMEKSGNEQLCLFPEM